MLAQLLDDTRGCPRVIAPTATLASVPAPEVVDPIALVVTAENALSGLLATLQGGEDGTPDVDFAELLSRLGNVVGRAADVAKKTADTLKDVDGESFKSAGEKCAATVPGLRSDAAYLEAAAGHAEDGQDELAETVCIGGEHRYTVQTAEGVLYAGPSWGSAVSALADATPRDEETVEQPSVTAVHVDNGTPCAEEAGGVAEQAAAAAAVARQHPLFDADPATARQQVEQRYLNRVRRQQETAGVPVPASGFPGLAEWQSEVLQACTCGGPEMVADCPVHAPLVAWLTAARV
ncbi:hypothetical protein [Streptosporangium sp. NPDC048865]|uniref:hypothetical protein n=1 Tax=Streptosporangium sp. NPDC048865 TaxID=3155766 RepID=UPI0034292980